MNEPAAEPSSHVPLSPHRSARLRQLLWLAGALLVAVIAWARGWPGPITTVDISQPRFSLPAPVPQGAQVVNQSFRPAHDGLTAIELRLARRSATTATDGQLTLSLRDESGALVAQRTLFTGNFDADQAYTLTFSPQPDSAGQVYRLSFSGNETNDLTFWAYELDVHQGGELNPAAQVEGARDLYFTTRYQLTAVAALRRLGSLWGTAAGVFVLALLLLLLPGRFLLAISRVGHEWDPAARWGVALALGGAFWALAWLWGSWVGLRWAGWSVAGVLIGAAGAAAAMGRGRGGQGRGGQGRGGQGRGGQGRGGHGGPPVRGGAAGAVVVIAISVRLLAVRDDLFPLWVDASRHALITAVMRTTGQTIDTYAPLLAVDEPAYHYGFHALPASLLLLADWPLAETLLYLGQLLNGLTPLAAYAGLWLVTRRRDASLLAAFLVALPFYFPAYYSTWGRFTQLTGMLLLPPLLGLTWQLLHGGPRWRRCWPLVALLAAGLFLIHARVFLFYLPFVALAWLMARGRGGRKLLLAGMAGGLLVLPRLWRLLQLAGAAAVLSASEAGYNQFPTSYVTVGWERVFLWLALPAALLAIWGAARRQGWARWPLGLLLWVGALFFLLAGAPLGLPELWLVNLNSMYITLYLPLAWLLGLTGARLYQWLLPRRHLGALLPVVAGALLMVLALFGARQQVNILNPATRLARPTDAAGLTWVAENLPPEALIANSAWDWLGGAWAGTDGGAWLLPVTGRQTTTPPVDYIFDPDLVPRVAAFNQAAQAVPDWADPAAVAWLRAQNVTHLFVGAREGYLDPAQLARNPALRLLWGQDGVFVFGLVP